MLLFLFGWQAEGQPLESFRYLGIMNVLALKGDLTSKGIALNLRLR